MARIKGNKCQTRGLVSKRQKVEESPKPAQNIYPGDVISDLFSPRTQADIKKLPIIREELKKKDDTIEKLQKDTLTNIQAFYQLEELHNSIVQDMTSENDRLKRQIEEAISMVEQSKYNKEELAAKVEELSNKLAKAEKKIVRDGKSKIINRLYKGERTHQ